MCFAFAHGLLPDSSEVKPEATVWCFYGVWWVVPPLVRFLLFFGSPESGPAVVVPSSPRVLTRGVQENETVLWARRAVLFIGQHSTLARGIIEAEVDFWCFESGDDAAVWLAQE